MTSEESIHLELLELSTESVENTNNSAYSKKLNLEPTEKSHDVKQAEITEQKQQADEEIKLKDNFIWTRVSLKKLNDCEGTLDRGNILDIATDVVHSIIYEIINEVADKAIPIDAEGMLHAIDEMHDCNIHGDVEVKSVVQNDSNNNVSVTEKANTNDDQGMLNAIDKTHDCEDHGDENDINNNVSVPEVDTNNRDWHVSYK